MTPTPEAFSSDHGGQAALGRLAPGTPLEVERRFLLVGPPPAERLEQLACTTMVQTYLLGPKGVRVRVRHCRNGGVDRYFRTAKSRLSHGVAQEDEAELDETTYRRLLADADPARRAVHKRRWVAPSGGHVVEIDHLTAPVEVWMAEVELSGAEALGDALELPAWLGVVREITGVDGWSNAALSRGVLPSAA